MRTAIERALGPFDLVTALCSLYYLPEDGMIRVLQRARELSQTIVLQANEETPPIAATQDVGNLGAGEHRGSTDYLKWLLEGNGYPVVGVHAPPGFSRPLLVGRQ
jgi:hypothetical protein